MPRAQPSPPERHPLEEYGQLEPQVQAENLWALPLDGAQGEAPVDLDAQHPAAQRHQARDEADDHSMPRRPPRSYGKMIRIGLVLTLIVAVGSLLVWQRSNIVDLAGGVIALFRPSAAPPREAAAPARPKITDRIGQPSRRSRADRRWRSASCSTRRSPTTRRASASSGSASGAPKCGRRPGVAPDLAVRADVEMPERKIS